MTLLKYLLLLSFIICPQVLVTFDAEKGPAASHKINFHVVDNDFRIINIQAAMVIAGFEEKNITTVKSNANNKKVVKPNDHAVKIAIPPSLPYAAFDSLYDGLTLSDASSFGKKLHELIESREDDGSIMNRDYSHYLIDRLVIESGTRLSYSEKQEKIQYLIESRELSVTERQTESEVDFLMHALATLPLGVESPQWREGWYSRLQQWPEMNETDHNEANNHYDGWRIRMSDYQQVRAQLVLQLGDQQDVFKVAQEDLRNSYFTDEEVALITITDNTIDLLNNINQ